MFPRPTRALLAISITQITANHTWHVHENRVGGDAVVQGGELCSAAGSHFNPLKVCKVGCDVAYGERCGPGL